LLILKAPLIYVQEVLWAFGNFWLPSSGYLANFNSRAVQLLWAVVHFFLVGSFALNLILLFGAAIYINACNAFGGNASRLPPNEARLIHSYAFVYGLAATIVIYTAAVSCLTEVGLPRYRLPTDVLIVFMFFLGTHLWRRLVDLSRD